MSDLKWDPDWVIRPGETLRDWREEIHLPAKAAARVCGLDPATYAGVEAGSRKIDEQIAARLAHGTSIPAKLWLNLERIYRAGLAAGKKDVSDS